MGSRICMLQNHVMTAHNYFIITNHDCSKRTSISTINSIICFFHCPCQEFMISGLNSWLIHNQIKSIATSVILTELFGVNQRTYSHLKEKRNHIWPPLNSYFTQHGWRGKCFQHYLHGDQQMQKLLRWFHPWFPQLKEKKNQIRKYRKINHTVQTKLNKVTAIIST